MKLPWSWSIQDHIHLTPEEEQKFDAVQFLMATTPRGENGRRVAPTAEIAAKLEEHMRGLGYKVRVTLTANHKIHLEQDK